MTHFRRLTSAVVLALSVSTLNACGSDGDSGGSDGQGTARFSVWGEEFIEDEIPAEEFADGWTASFDRFLIVVGDVRVRDDAAGEGGSLSTSRLYNLKLGRGSVGELDLGARAWADVGYRVAPINSSTELAEGVTEADRTLMEDGGLSIYVSGSATKEGVTKTFSWGFSTDTRYSECVSVGEGREVAGVTIANGGVTPVELTIHGDHFFYDDLAADTAQVRFEALASADADDDGDITQEELSAIKLFDLTEGTYGTGGASDIDDLGAFLRGQTRTLGHFNGEGHCVVE